MDGTGIEKLRASLTDIPEGEIKPLVKEGIEGLLCGCWSELRLTSGDGGLEPYKLLKRTEGMAWKPPLLTFKIERHGGTVMGSTYAEIQNWEVNLETGEATLDEHAGRRQVYKRDTPLNVKPLAEELARAIVEHKEDPRLKWHGESKVRVLVTAVIPATNQQTTSGRRKRFSNALEEALRPHCWLKAAGRHTFERTQKENIVMARA